MAIPRLKKKSNTEHKDPTSSGNKSFIAGNIRFAMNLHKASYPLPHNTLPILHPKVLAKPSQRSYMATHLKLRHPSKIWLTEQKTKIHTWLVSWQFSHGLLFGSSFIMIFLKLGLL